MSRRRLGANIADDIKQRNHELINNNKAEHKHDEE